MRTWMWVLACLLAGTGLAGTVRPAWAQAPTTPPPAQPAPQPPPPQYPAPQTPPPQYPQQPPPGYPPPQQPPGYPPPQQPQYPPQYPQPQYPPAPSGYPPPGYGSYPAPAPYYALPPEPQTRIRRNGFTLGMAIGGGSVHFQDEPHAGFAFQFGVGGMLNRSVGVLFDYSTISHDVSSAVTESHSIFGVVAQLFLAEPLWIKAGLGIGRMAASDGWVEIDRTERSFAFIGGAGFDVIQTTSGFALDLQLRFTGASYQDAGFTSNTALLVGFNFY